MSSKELDSQDDLNNQETQQQDQLSDPQALQAQGAVVEKEPLHGED